MLNQIQTQNTSQTPMSFKGKTFRPDKFAKKGYERYGEIADKIIPFDTYRAYSPVRESFVKLQKSEFGYQTPTSSELSPYIGDMSKGLSTESGGYGGGWLKADMGTPLSTTDVHTCALLHLVNEQTHEHFLYHVFESTLPEQITKFISENFPRFNKVNIVPGDAPKTNTTVNNILLGVNNVNSNAEKKFFHFSTKTPEIVAHNGTLSYMPTKSDSGVTFKQVSQYNY